MFALSHLSPKFGRPASARRLPVLATIPRSGTWFLRYSIAFFSHLKAGGRIDDRLSGCFVGARRGAAFDFSRFQGGPLFRVAGALPVEHLFVGHTVCPGFCRIAGEVPWWKDTPFHAPGYDYFHAGLNYAFTPVDLDARGYVAIDTEALDRAPWLDPYQRIVLVYRDPLEQLDSFYDYSRDHAIEANRTFHGRPVAEVRFGEFAFGGALASYAKQFISYQNMAVRLPAQVRLVSYDRLMKAPVEELADILDFLMVEGRVDRSILALATTLARPEHLQAVERELGRSLDGNHTAQHSHMRQRTLRLLQGGRDRQVLRPAAIEWLAARGVDVSYFDRTVVPVAAARPLRAS